MCMGTFAPKPPWLRHIAYAVTSYSDGATIVYELLLSIALDAPICGLYAHKESTTFNNVRWHDQEMAQWQNNMAISNIEHQKVLLYICC